MGDAKA
jgi:hypothetical protein